MGDVEWTEDEETRAVHWLSERTGKPIRHLETADYREHHLGALVARHGDAEPLNGKIFNRLIAKIRGRSKLPSGRRVVVFSPHPDDDVISMGGILRKLGENDNELTVAYQTSGNIAVFDHEVRRYLAFVDRSAGTLGIDDRTGIDRTTRHVLERLADKAPVDVDVDTVQAIKKAIRETEAVSGLVSSGLRASAARFLDLPFYQTGKVRKDPITDADIDIVLALLEEKRPEIVFAAGDLSDPHGTHRMCLEAVEAALARYSGPTPQLWLYRGAWQEWSVDEASVLVPLSAGELRKKIQAIFKHQSQKDTAPFPGPDPREFWQRVQDRNRGTADLLRRRGLPAYYAMEAFVIFEDGRRLESPDVPTASLGENGA